MPKRLKDNINSRYFEAANALTSKKARHRIVAYVESYDDIYFWRTVLSEFENDKRYFEVMLPSKINLTRGKKSVLMNFLEGAPLGRDMIACVDADYDYLLQGCTAQSRKVLDSPYVFHTYVYAIENYQCYAPSLHNVCVSVTLNDHRIFDFRAYFQAFSVNVKRKVNTKINELQRQFPDAKEEYMATKEDIKALGVTAQTTYLYIQGHHLFDTVVSPIMSKVCNLLRQERQNEIYYAMAHKTQKRNEMTCYENSLQDIKAMLKKNNGYMTSEPFRRLQEDVREYLDSF